MLLHALGVKKQNKKVSKITVKLISSFLSARTAISIFQCCFKARFTLLPCAYQCFTDLSFVTAMAWSQLGSLGLLGGSALGSAASGRCVRVSVAAAMVSRAWACRWNMLSTTTQLPALGL